MLQSTEKTEVSDIGLCMKEGNDITCEYYSVYLYSIMYQF